MKASIIFLVLAVPQVAHAIPRFAARNGMECIQCHVNPTGGGIRNAYGRSVFEQAWLPLFASDGPTSWLADDAEKTGEEAGENDEAGEEQEAKVGPLSWFPAFGAEIGEWLAIGADLRTAYIFIHPDLPTTPGEPVDITSSFFLMQADLYHSARLNQYVTLVLDVGIYSGFEAWALFHVWPSLEAVDLYLKVGKFMPPFGIREVEHQLFTRESIGFGSAGRDTGVELTAYAGPLTWNLALVNGSLADASFDTAGAEHTSFEKAISTRLSGAMQFGLFRAQLGASFYFSDNVNQPNPLFSATLPPTTAPESGRGANELRVGGFATANIGRLTYLGEMVFVHDDFVSEQLGEIYGYVSYQELSFVPFQGLELVMTHEFMDPDMQLVGNAAHRFGVVAEFFPISFTEVRFMVRRLWSNSSATGGAWDFVLFAHVFM